MAVDASEYITKNARTLQSNKKCAKSRPVSESLGLQNTPLLNFEPTHIIPDELHLLLRISDVLIRNLINHMVQTARKTQRGTAVTTYTSTQFKKLEDSARDCGITFRVWKARDPDGKPSGKYESTSIMGNDVKKLFRLLPPKFSNFLDCDVTATMAQI